MSSAFGGFGGDLFVLSVVSLAVFMFRWLPWCFLCFPVCVILCGCAFGVVWLIGFGRFVFRVAELGGFGDVFRVVGMVFSVFPVLCEFVMIWFVGIGVFRRWFGVNDCLFLG